MLERPPPLSERQELPMPKQRVEVLGILGGHPDFLKSELKATSRDHELNVRASDSV